MIILSISILLALITVVKDNNYSIKIIVSD